MATLPKSGIQLTAQNADLFLKQLAAAESAVDRFRKAAARATPFGAPDTRNAVATFNSLVEQAQGAGQNAGTGMSMGIGSGLSATGTIVQGALLKIGAVGVDIAIGIGQSIGSAISTSFNDALKFGAAIDSIAALADGGVAASEEIAATIGSIATSPTLIANTESATAAFAALEKQGVPTKASVDGLVESTIALQNASGKTPGNLTEIADAAEAVGQGYALFGLNAQNAGAYVDTLAAITTNSKFTLGDLNYTLANSASQIQSLGLSFEDVGVAAIATGSAFSSARTQATALDAFLAGLSAPTDKMKDALAQLGVSAYDSQGNFVGLISLQDQLQASFNSGTYTTQAFQQLLTEGFGSVGRDFAVAIAKGEDFNTTLDTIRETSASAIAAIKTDNAATALENLKDVAADLGRRLSQPFTEILTPAIQSMSGLLSSLAGYFDALGQRIAAALSPVLTAITGQFNALAVAIGNLTGIQVPTAGAAPTIGPQPAPGIGVGAGRESTFTGGAAGSDSRQQERIGVAQLDAAENSKKAAKSMSATLSQLDDILSSSVSALDVNLSNEGLYEDKPDEKLRQLRAYVKNGSEEYAGVADDYRVALERIGVKPAEDMETFLMQVEELQASKAIFADPRNIELLIDEEAVKREVEMKELAQKGAQNIALAFGDYVAGLVDATSSGLSGGAAPAATTPAATPADPTAFYDPYELYVKPVQDAQVAQAKQAASSQEGLLGGLFTQFDTLGEKFGTVTGLFEGFNGLLTGLSETVQGQDFQAAGLAVGGTLTTVLGALTQITELSDLGTTTANLSTFTQTILDSAANFADGIDGEAVAESAGTLLTTIVGKLTEAVDGADLTGIATSYTNYMAKASGLFVEAIHGFNFAGVGLSIGTLVSRVANQLIGALQDPTVASNLGDTAGNFATTAIGAVKGAFETLGGALAVADENTDAGEITTGISNMVTTVVSRFTSAVNQAKLDDLGTEITGMVGHVANLFLEAVQGVQFDAIGTAIGEMVGTIVNKFTELISNPQVGIDLGQAAGDFVSGIITAVQGAFTLLSSALTGADDTIDITALTGAIDGVVQGFVQGFIASITRNFTNPDTGAIEIAVPTINAVPLTPIDLSTLVQYIGELPAPQQVDRATLVEYINELPPEFQVEKDKLVAYINELPPGQQVDRAALVSYINELPGATEVDKAKLVSYVNALPEPTEVDQSKLVQVTGALPDAVNIDLSSLVTFTGTDGEGADVQSGFGPLTEAINLLAPALTGISIGIGLVDQAFKKAAEPGGGFDQLTQLVTGTIDTITQSVADVDVAAIGGALSGVLTSLGSLFVTLSEIPDLAPITESIGGFVTALLDLSSGLVGSVDGEQVGTDISTVASNLISRLAEGISAVPLEEIGVAAANLVGALAGTFRDAFTVENLSGVGESIGGLVTDIINKLTSTLGDPAFGETLGQAFGDFVAGIVQGAAGLIQGLGAGVDSEAVAGIGDALFTFVTSFVGGVADSLATVNWGEVAQAIYDGITGGIGSLFSGAESLADSVFGLGFSGGQALAEATGLQGTLSTDSLAEAGQGAINFFGPIATKLSTDLATAFGEGKVYTADIATAVSSAGGNLSGDISTYFAEDAIYPETISTGLANAATGITSAFGGILDAVTGFWDSLLSALPDWAKGLLGIGGTEAAPPSPEETQVAKDLQNNLATKDDVANLANQTRNAGTVSVDAAGLGGEYGPPTTNTTTNTTITNITQAPAFDPATYAGASSFDGSTIPVVIQNPEAIAQPTTNADGSLTAAGQEQAVANLGALFGGLSANLSEAIAPAIAQAGGQLAGAVGSLQGQAQIGPPSASSYNPLSSATTVEVKPVELSENAATLLNNYATAQAQAAAQGQDTAAPMPTAEDLLAGVTAALPSYFYQTPEQEQINLVSSSLVGLSTGTDAAGLGGEYGPPVVQAIADNTAAINSLAATQASQPAIGPAMGDVEPLEFGADTVKLLEEQTEAITLNTSAQATQAGSETGAAANPKTAQELKTLETTIPNAGQKFTVSLTGTAGVSTVASEKIDKLSNSADEAVTPIDNLSAASDDVTGSFNILLDKTDKTAQSVSDLNDAFADDGLTGGIEGFTDALDQAVDDINAALQKLDGGSDTPPEDSNPTQPKPFARGGAARGLALVGEEGPELAVNPLTGATSLVGQRGPEIKRFVSPTEIYTADETEAILRRSGKPTAIGSFADGTGNAAGSALVGEDGPEIIWNREQQSAWLVGQQGPQVVDLPAGSSVYTNEETEAILRRSGEPTNDATIGSFAGGTGGAAINGLIGEPITSEFKYIPQGSSSDVGMAGIQGLVGEPIAMRADGGATAGKALVGEEGPELAYNPVLQNAFIVGQQGPEIRDFASNTEIYTAAETDAILASSGEPTATGSFADGGTPAGKALVGEEGPELAYDPVLQSAYLIGERGPEIREFTPNTQIYTAEETEAILRRSGGSTDNVMGSFAGGLLGNLASLLNQNAATPSASPTALPTPTPSPTPIPTLPGGPVTIPQGDEGIQDDTEEATVTEQTSLLDNPFVRAILGKQLGGQQQAGGGAFKSVASQFNSGDSFDVEKLVDAFNRPLFGRMSPASVTVNITVNNNSNVDNSVRTYTLGGISTQQRTESIIDSFKLLQSAFG